MSTAEFRASPDLVKEARELLNRGIFSMMLDTLDKEAPHRKRINTPGELSLLINDEHFAAVQLGRIAGFEEFRSKLLSLAEFQKLDLPADIGEPTYTDSTQPEEKQNA